MVTVAAIVVGAACSAGTTSAKPLRAAPEPAVSPPATKPTGTVLPLRGTPEGVVITRSGVVAIAVRDPSALVLFPLSQPTQRRTVPLPGAARHLALAGADGPLLAPGEDNDHLIQVELPSGRGISSTTVGRQPHDAAAFGPSIIVGDELADTANIVGGGSSTVVTAPVQPGGVAAAADGSVAVVVGVRGRRIAAYRPDGTLIGMANCGAGPTHVVTGDPGLFWVADTNGDAVLAFRVGATGPRQVATVPLGKGSRPYGLAYDHRRATLWVTLTGRDQLVGLHVRGNATNRGRTLLTVRQPNSVAVDDDGGSLVVTGSTPEGSLQLIDNPA